MGILDTSKIREAMKEHLETAGLSMSQSQNVTVQETAQNFLGDLTENLTNELSKK